MGFLHKLWDETLAGPTPETGLGMLRKYDSFSYGGGAAAETARSPPPLPPMRSVEEGMGMPVTRSITLLRTHSSLKNISVDPGSDPGSPDGCSTPGTPLTPGTPARRHFFKGPRRRTSAAEVLENAEPSSPTVYDWIVISALDR